MAEQKASLIFIPFPVISHLLSTIMMAKLLADRDDRLSITVLILKLQSDNKIAAYITNSPDSRINSVEIESSRNQKGPVRAAVSAVTGGPKPAKLDGLFVDILCVSMIDAAAELSAPAFVFFTCGAAILGLMFRLQGLMDGRDRSLAEYEDSVSTYVNPVPAKVWPSSVFNRDGGLMRKLREGDGIVVNTFLELESNAITALAGDGRIPWIYPVGPLVQEARFLRRVSMFWDLWLLQWGSGEGDRGGAGDGFVGR